MRIKTSTFASIYGAIWFLIIIIGIAAIAGGSSNNTSTTTEEKFTLVSDKKTTDAIGTTYIEGEIKNNTNKEYSYVQVTFNLYDKNLSLTSFLVSFFP